MSTLTDLDRVELEPGEVLRCLHGACGFETDDLHAIGPTRDCPSCGGRPSWTKAQRRHPVADRIGEDSAALGWTPVGHAVGRFGYLLGLDALDRSLLFVMLSYADADSASMRPAVGRVAVQAGMSTGSAKARLRGWLDAGLFERASGKPTGRPSTYSARGLRVAEGALARAVLAARGQNLRDGTDAFERFVREHVAPVLAVLRNGGHQLATPMVKSWPPDGQELATMKNHMKNHDHQESEQSSGHDPFGPADDRQVETSRHPHHGVGLVDRVVIAHEPHRESAPR